MNAIEIKDLCKSYDGFAIDRLSLTVPQGCIVGLIGENGAGKSTTINLILDTIHKDSGSITLLGNDNTQNTSSLKEDIGVVPDEPGFPECLTAAQVNSIMKYTFTNWDETAFNNYISMLKIPAGKPFKDFSRGMKMKLSIAVAMSHNAKLLILDEPTGGLDPVVRDEVIDMFNEFTRDENHSILISSHIVSDLEKICDYIAFIHKGRLLLFEEKDALLDRHCIVQCSEEQFNSLPEQAVKGVKKTPFGINAIVEKEYVPSDIQKLPVTIEELFVFMVKEA